MIIEALNANVNYEMYLAQNNKKKQMCSCKYRIVGINPTRGVTPFSDTLKLEDISSGFVINSNYSIHTLLLNTYGIDEGYNTSYLDMCVSNPSILKNWRGWNYTYTREYAKCVEDCDTCKKNWEYWVSRQHYTFILGQFLKNHPEYGLKYFRKKSTDDLSAYTMMVTAYYNLNLQLGEAEDVRKIKQIAFSHIQDKVFAAKLADAYRNSFLYLEEIKEIATTGTCSVDYKVFKGDDQFRINLVAFLNKVLKDEGIANVAKAEKNYKYLINSIKWLRDTDDLEFIISIMDKVFFSEFAVSITRHVFEVQEALRIKETPELADLLRARARNNWEQ